LWPGSHRWKTRNEEAVPELLEISPGSAAILDSRLLNGATANRSDRPHTVLGSPPMRSLPAPRRC
ncbi:MAG: hypothetical protein J0H22_15625, partial [Actinobacteria bacterium]|nr:hypothetical protein [Actinomycetota bacterium]